MVNCCVPGYVNHSAKSNGISYHKFLQDCQLQKAWLHQIRRTNMPLLEYSYVCSYHFPMDSFEVNLRAEITGQKCKQRLKQDAVPSEFSFHPAAKKLQPSSENRCRRQSHQEVSVSCQFSLICI